MVLYFIFSLFDIHYLYLFTSHHVSNKTSLKTGRNEMNTFSDWKNKSTVEKNGNFAVLNTLCEDASLKTYFLQKFKLHI